jgi:DNA-directed RNA polymerase subunit L
MRLKYYNKQTPNPGFVILFVVDSPPRLDAVDIIKTEYTEDMRMETDFYRVNEPQVDIIQTCDVQTQTDTTPERQVLQKLHSLENSMRSLREECKRDREKQNVLMEKNIRRMFENQKLLMDEFFAKTKCLLEAEIKD